MTVAVSFKRNGAIVRAGIRVGWIEDDPLRTPGRRWKLRYTAAAGLGDVPPERYDRLKDAKMAAIALLTPIGELPTDSVKVMPVPVALVGELIDFLGTVPGAIVPGEQCYSLRAALREHRKNSEVSRK